MFSRFTGFSDRFILRYHYTGNTNTKPRHKRYKVLFPAIPIIRTILSYGIPGKKTVFFSQYIAGNHILQPFFKNFALVQCAIKILGVGRGTFFNISSSSAKKHCLTFIFCVFFLEECSEKIYTSILKWLPLRFIFIGWWRFNVPLQGILNA